MLALWRGAPEKELPKACRRKIKKDDDGADDKCAEVKGGQGGQLHTMFTPSVDIQSGIDFIELG